MSDKIQLMVRPGCAHGIGNKYKAGQVFEGTLSELISFGHKLVEYDPRVAAHMFPGRAGEFMATSDALPPQDPQTGDGGDDGGEGNDDGQTASGPEFSRAALGVLEGIEPALTDEEKATIPATTASGVVGKKDVEAWLAEHRPVEA